MGIVIFCPWYPKRFLNYAEYRVYRGSESSCLILKYNKSTVENCLLPYFNHLKRHRKPGLIRPLMKS